MYYRCTAVFRRSAALHKLGRPAACLADIELALELGYPAGLHYKLVERGARCRAELGGGPEQLQRDTFSLHQAAAVAGLPSEKLDRMVTDLAAHASNQVTRPRVEKKTRAGTGSLCREPHPQLAGLSAGLEIRSEPDRGRFIVATRHIRTGEVKQ